MSSGEMFKEIREAIKEPNGMTQEVRDTLILTGIVNLYEELEKMRPLLPMYRVLVLFGGILVSFVGAFLWGIFTGEIKVVF